VYPDDWLPVKRIIPAAAILAALLLSGCVPGASDPYTESARQTLESLHALEGSARTEAVMAFAAAGEADARLASGIDAAVGGARADGVFTGLLAPLADTLGNGGPAATFTPASYRATGGGAIATFLGLAFTMIGEMGQSAMTNADNGEFGSESGPIPGGTGDITVTPEGHASSTFSTTLDEGSVHASLTASTDVQPCPAADGSVELSGSSDVSIAVGTTTLSISLEVVATGRLDDSATLVESDYTYRHETASSDGGKGEFFDHSSGANLNVTVNRSSSAATLAFAQSAVDSAAALADMVAKDMMDVAKRGWESGRCISLTLTASEDPGSLQPSTEITIDAAPTSTLDGKPAGGTVVAQLSGRGTLDPDGGTQDAAATLTYVAGDEKGDSGTVTAESRSNRGVGRATLTLDVGGQAYSAVGSEGELTVNGRICSLTAQFAVTGSGLTFTPAGDWGGSFRMTGTVDGVGFIGDGAYTLVRDADFVATNLVMDGDIVLSLSDGTSVTSPTDMNITLTPIPPCE
jgi:outer membrane murein-binding lipoprotein Lpp